MRKILILFVLFLSGTFVFGQTPVLIEGIDSVVTAYQGYNISRSSAVSLTFRNNYVESGESDGFILQAGDDDYISYNAHNLDGASIRGNWIRWDGADHGTHGVMAGYNIDYDIRYNLIDSSLYGIVHEGGYPDHSTMVNTSSYIAYNIFKNGPYFTVVEKGFDGTVICNNTFFSNIASKLAFILLRSSDTGGFTTPYPITKNTKVYNNIFYSTTATPVVWLGEDTDDTYAEMDTVGLKWDYNVYYFPNSPSHEPTFEVMGEGYSWTEWRALGYDAHSVIIDPDFIDFVDLVPSAPLEYGIDLGSDVEYGLATTADWVVGEYPDTTIQGDVWQVGARIYPEIYEADYYVATDGSNSNPGTYEEPWLTLQYAFDQLSAGDTLYVRGGTYYPPSNGSGINFDASGTVGNYISVLNYPGETPIIDGSNITSGSYPNGIWLYDESYVRFRGITIRNIPQIGTGDSGTTGFEITDCHDIIFDNCVAHSTGGSGFKVSYGYEIYFNNCDSYDNVDTETATLPGNDGYGFNIYATNTDCTVYYDGCRAWGNGDDGFSGMNNGYSEYTNCWAFDNGRLEGGGNGFKLGWLQTQSSSIRRVMTNCLSIYNGGAGITTNDDTDTYPGAMHIYNNTLIGNGWMNSYYYGMYIYNTVYDAGESLRYFYNNICILSNYGDVYVASGANYTHSNNTWDGGGTGTAGDFRDLPDDEDDANDIMSASRQSDGSLPDIGDYFQLVEGSDLIDAGTDVGLDYSGDAPDIGYAEYEESTMSDATDIIAFILSAQTGSATINATTHTVGIEVAYTADVTDLTPTITLSSGATVIPASGVSRDFTSPLPYTVTAEDEVTYQEWTVTVTQEEEPDEPPVETTGSIVKFRGKIVKR